jgi:type VI secretion system secreted protein Hcp
MAFDVFLKLDGVPGESTDAKHKDEIDLLSFNFGATRDATGGTGGGGAGKVQFHDFSFVMRTNKSSPRLLQHTADGKHIESGIVTLRKAGKEQLEYLVIKLSDLLVTSHQTGADAQGADNVPMEQVTLNFSKIEYEYRPQKADGSADTPIKMSWDIKTNKPS